jgi:L-amino acid N-acyltransferase YncA
MFVAEKDGIVIGLLVATLNEYRHAEGLYTTQEVIYVDEAHRGGRAATLLMKQLIAWSEEIGAIEITGGNDNGFQSERTAAFLEHFGFERVGFFMRREV